jgi:hypothetical protein
MRKIGIGVAIGLALLSACSAGTDVPMAAGAADSFHKQLNAGDYQAIYDASDRLMKNSMLPKPFVEMLTVVHKKLGDFKSAEQPGWNDQVTTNGHFVTLIYHATYVRGSAEENFVFRIDGQRAVLAGYHVNSQALILN